jgi:hypothetical protein
VTCHATAKSGGYVSWVGGGYVHSASDTNCSSCHNGTTATGHTTPPHVPVTGVQCSNCHTNTATSFTSYTMNHGAVTSSRCDSCHNGSYTSQGTRGALGTASFAGHVATNGADCATCHAKAVSGGYASWAGGGYVHSASDINCSSCHNGTTATGHTTPPHVPVTGVQCSNCHTNTATSFTSYTMNHGAVTSSRCDSCHNGSYTSQGTKGALGTASFAGHVATNGQDCVTCHATAVSGGYVSWVGGMFTHSASDTNCSSCHNGTTATGHTTPPHIPVTGIQCSNCHVNTAPSFTTYTMGVTGHTAVSASRCDACHNGSYTSQGTTGALGTASFAGHVPTNGADCKTCHATAATTFASWAGGVHVHAATDTNCSSCHNGVAATGNTTPPHIPVTGIQCSNCHVNTAPSFTTYTMTHSAVTSSRCDACHNGSYTSQGTSGAQAKLTGHIPTGTADCISCHASTTSFDSSGSATTCKMTHAAVTGVTCATCHNGVNAKGDHGSGTDCGKCHTPKDTACGSYSTFVHSASDTNCSSCHNGTTAIGMTTPPHVPTATVQCSNCHTNTAPSFTTYTMNHGAVTSSRCDSCHNGSYTSQGTKGALGTASFAGHVATNGADCVTCHATAVSGGYVSWAGGAHVHAATDTNCSSCHNGTTATGHTTPPHIPTGTVQCSNCHVNTAPSFTTYTMGVTGHTAVSASRCDACHNGSYTSQGTTGALGTASFAGHVPTNGADCKTCHTSAATTFTSWAGAAHVHAATDTNCSSCHNGTTATGHTTPPHIPTGTVQCSNCHVNTAPSFTTYTMGVTGHTAVSASRCDSCHNGSYTSQGTTGALGTASFAGHVPTNGADCKTCHASAATTFASWAGAVHVHAATDTNCSSCHNGTTATGHTTPPHIPVTGIQCSNCHTNTAPSFTTYTMGATGHTAVSASRCDSCHNGSYTSQGTKGALGTASFAGHVATNSQDCVTCHAKAVSGGYVSWAGGGFVHSATDTNCSSCHNGTTATGNTTPPHIPVAGIQCSNCHTNTATSFTTYTMGTTGHAAVHATRCDTCHNGSYTSQGTKGAQGPAHSAKSQDCGCCHVQAATSFTSWSGTQSPAAGCVTTAKSLVAAQPTTLAVVKSAMHSVVSRAIAAITSVMPSTSSGPKGSQPSAIAPAIKAAAPATNSALPAKTTAVGTPTGSPGANANILFNNKPVSTQAFTPSATASMPAAGTNASNFAKIAPLTSSGTAKVGPSAQPSATATPTPAASPLAQKSGLMPNSIIRSAQAPQTEPSGAAPATPQLKPGLAASGASSTGAAKFNHATVQGQPCASCHNGTTAIGKSARHIPTNAPCDTCHKSTITFAGARFNHAATTAACATCHNGTTAIGKPPRHLATTAACDTCHKSTVAWDIVRVDHTNLTAPCASCHNGTAAIGKPQTHFVTTLPCDSCHRTVSWSAATYRHMSATYPDHGKPIECKQCHSTNSQIVPWKFAAYKPDCAACHAQDFRPQQHVKYLKPVPMYYTVAELKDCTGACHTYLDRTMTVIETRRPRGHRVNGAGW